MLAWKKNLRPDRNDSWLSQKFKVWLKGYTLKKLGKIYLNQIIPLIPDLCISKCGEMMTLTKKFERDIDFHLSTTFKCSLQRKVRPFKKAICTIG